MKIFGISVFVLFPIYLVVAWPLVMWLISRMSGWATLAKFYRATRPFVGQRYRFQSGTLGKAGSRFNNVLNLGVNEEGLYLSLLFPFGLYSPPLLIPWDDISAQNTQLIWKFVELHFRQAPEVPLRLYESLGRQIMQHKP